MGPISVFALLIAAGSVADGQAVLPDGTVRFQSGSADLTTESVETLERLAGILKRRPELDPVLLVGHADDRGSEAVNIRLSKGRADAVRLKLVELGIRHERLQTKGAGSAEPLVEGTSDEARGTNRRVEVWVTPQDAVARVARVERDVLSKEAAARAWRDARVDMPLRRRAQVRTLKRSSSEIVFQKKDKIGLGPEALVVIFGSPSQTKRSQRSVADIEVQRGSIFAALAEREARTMDVETNSGRVLVKSKRTRIDVRKKQKRVSTVSVFDGRSEVSNEGKSVSVRQGYGTRVTEGAAPEAPRPLPMPPVWSSARPLEAFEGDPIPLEWTRAAGVAAVELQVGMAGDVAVERPVRLEQVDADQTDLVLARSGLYHIRLAGIDERDIRGEASTSRLVIVWPQIAGIGIKRMGRGVRVGQPQVVEVHAPRGTSFVHSDGATTKTSTLTLVRPGRHFVEYVVTSTNGVVHRGRTAFEVTTATVTATTKAQPSDGVSASTKVRLHVTAAEQPVRGLVFVAGRVPSTTARLTMTASSARGLAACNCVAPSDPIAVREEGDGYYSFDVRTSPTLNGPIPIRVVETRGNMAVELDVTSPPRVVAVKDVGVLVRNGWFGGITGGALLGHADAPTFTLGVEAGGRLHVAGPFELDLFGRFGWFRRTLSEDNDVDVFPLVGRAAIAWVLGVPRLYLGGGIGGRFSSPSNGVEPAAEAFAGLGYAVGEQGELRVEAVYGTVGRIAPLEEELAGFMATVTFRFGSWRRPAEESKP